MQDTYQFSTSWLVALEGIAPDDQECWPQSVAFLKYFKALDAVIVPCCQTFSIFLCKLRALFVTIILGRLYSSILLICLYPEMWMRISYQTSYSGWYMLWQTINETILGCICSGKFICRVNLTGSVTVLIIFIVVVCVTVG